jgi:porphobilinogen synthase
MTLIELVRQNLLRTSTTGPAQRLRRLRTTPALRAMVRETELNPRDFIYPLFVRHGDGRNEIRSMPGIYQLSVEEAVLEAESAASLGIGAVLLFGIPVEKDPIGLENFSPDGIVQQAIRAIKAKLPEMVVMTDVCMCEYTDHGHCGIINTGSHPNLPQG